MGVENLASTWIRTPDRPAGIILNIIIIHLVVVVVETVTGKERENKVRECSAKTPV